MSMNTSVRSPLTDRANGARTTMTLPALLLRLEGAALLAAAVLLYREHDASWFLFAALILAPDVSMLGYLAGVRIGAGIYNAAHTTVLPIILGVTGVLAGGDLAISLGLIWLAHIGLDRAIGYGLKYPGAFKATHLARVMM
jgi:hypothetical protein